VSWKLLNVAIEAPGPATIETPEASLVVFPATRAGEELAGRFAVENNAQFVGRVSGALVNGDDLIIRRAAFGGRIEVETRYPAGRLVATCNEPLSGGELVALSAPSEIAVETVPAAGGGMTLEGARLVVSGGRGLDAGDFQLLQELADRLGGAVGGSLPAVDLGLVPVSRQIGQSGKFVTPEVYLAVGLSGTPQHLAGVGAATRIIAINKDPTAPIFRFAEAGVVGDAKQILPCLLAALSKESSYV
jgi:electron transfer flavoprotein alpha subunit